MDINPLIQKTLGENERCLASVEAGLVQGWVKSPRILALVERHGQFGLVIFCTQRNPIFSTSDLIYDSVLPIYKNFKCVDDASGISSGADVPVKIVCGRKQIFFEVPCGSRTNVFMAAVKKSVEASYAIDSPVSYTWFDKYQSSRSAEALIAEVEFDPLKPSSTQTTNIDGGETAETSSCSSHESRPSTTCGGFDDNFTDSMAHDYMDKFRSSVDSASMISSLSKSMDDLDSIGLISDHFGPGTKPVTTNRDKQIQLYMADRETEFTIKRPMKIFCGTWNVNGQAASVNIHTWLSHDEIAPDIYALGFQELDLSKEAFIFNDSTREMDWYRQVSTSLHPSATYRKVRLIRLVGMMIVVFVKTDHAPHVSEISAEYVGTGLMGVMGNKGGVAIRLMVYNSTICFVNSHLAAHTEEFERRNQDVKDINARLQFNKFDPPLTISEHDIVFWFGDLNYRIGDLESETVKRLLRQGELTELMKRDQLYREMSGGRLFNGYKEPDICFIPTYKYDTGTDNWDTSDKCRVPAWCDRILYKGKYVNVCDYRSHPSLRISDHKPVSALFDVGIKVIDWVAHKKVYEDVMKQLDRIENEFLPQVTLDRVEMSFKDVMFVQPQTQYVIIANTGQVPVQFEFINKLDDYSYCKPWLTIKPYKRFIMPGESCEVEFEAYVNKLTAPMLNSRDDTIEDILVLHLHGGKDIFISISGNYIASSFGSSIEALVHMYGPIRDVPTAQLIDLEHIPATGATSRAASEPLDIPKEIWRLVNHIYKHGMQSDDLFQQPGLYTEIQNIRDSLDTGKPDEIPGSIHSVCEALLVFIESLPEPVITYSLSHRLLDNVHNFYTCKQIMSHLPCSHLNVFNYICAFLRKLLQYQKYNNLDAKFLSSLFGSVIIRLRTSSDTAPTTRRLATSQERARIQAIEKKKANLIHHFLINDDYIVTKNTT